jgi:excisionase family DNA binding protein
MAATQISFLDTLTQRLFSSRKEFMSFREASEQSSLSERTLRRLHQSGQLEARRIGNRLLLTRESFEKLLQSE